MTERTAGPCALVADIGGTHARFALVQANGDLTDIKIYGADDGADCAMLCRSYLDGLTCSNVTRAAWAVAGPVTGDEILITNRGWRFSQTQVQAEFGWDVFHVVNDFAALALSLPHLTDADTILIKPGRADRLASDQPLAVIGPGTGLGVAGLVPVGDNDWRVLATEGGHVSLPAGTAAEHDIVARLQDKFSYLAAEEVLSGRGLVQLAQAMHPDNAWQTPQDIAQAMEAGDVQAVAVVEQFCAFLGLVAGDAALTLGATGGVYLAGGILPRLADRLLASAFSARFTERRAVRSYLEAVPVRLITHKLPALLGLRALLAHRV